jgi:RNA polymerase sigma-70 factor (ECF subfamily)
LERVYDASFDRVYAIGYAAAGNHADAEDIAAEAYERAVRRIGTFRGSEEQMVHWIYGIARNVVHEYRRDRERTHQSLGDDDFEADAATPAELAESGMEAERLLASLPAAQREVMRLRLAGLKLREIAEVVGKAEGTVKALQFAAVKRLRREAGL